MYIFYDFETSSRELLGQILGYSFVVTDSKFNIKDELTGWIKLSRIQCPEPEAIRVNQIDLRTLQAEGLSEFESADRIYWFLDQFADSHPQLVGFNSNSFDLGFLRNLLIRHGRNPYFFGRIKNRDVLHWLRILAFENADRFPWQIEVNDDGFQYYSFRLEAMAKAFDCLTETQTHDAREDVMLTLNLVRAVEKRLKVKWAHYEPTTMDGIPIQKSEFEIARQRVAVYPDGADALQHFSTRYWVPLLFGKTDRVMVDLEKYLDQGAEAALRYFNLNKCSLVLESLSPPEIEMFKSALDLIRSDSILKTLTLEQYFKMIHKPWDIEYQIHEMGMERISDLRSCIESLVQNPDDYTKILQNLVNKRSQSQAPDKDFYLIQLFNRFYLANHPSPNFEHLMKYISPRYITGALVRNPADFRPFSVQFEQVKTQSQLPENLENPVVEGLLWYFTEFKDRFPGLTTD